jgi:hypothetical protein
MQDDPSAVAAKRNMEIQSQLEEESKKFPNQLRPLQKVLKLKAAQSVKDGWELDDTGVIALVADKGLDVGYKSFAKVYGRRGLEDAKVRKASFRMQGRRAPFAILLEASFQYKGTCIKLS